MQEVSAPQQVYASYAPPATYAAVPTAAAPAPVVQAQLLPGTAYTQPPGITYTSLPSTAAANPSGATYTMTVQDVEQLRQRQVPLLLKSKT